MALVYESWPSYSFNAIKQPIMPNDQVCGPTPLLSLKDDEVFKGLFDKLYEGIFAYCAIRLLHKEDAEDITHDAFTALFLNLGKITSEDHAKNFLYKVARYKIADHKKRNYSYNKTLLTFAAQFITMSEKMVEEQIDDMLRQVEQLPRKCRTIVKHFLDEKSPEEISSIMGINKKTVYNQYQNGAKKLKASLRSG